jgi:hypothetical protein
MGNRREKAGMRNRREVGNAELEGDGRNAE